MIEYLITSSFQLFARKKGEKSYKLEKSASLKLFVVCGVFPYELFFEIVGKHFKNSGQKTR